MIVYQSTKQGFRDDVFSNEIDKKILEAYKIHLGRSTSANETLSWKNSMSYMDRIMEDPDIPADAGISIEFQIPLTSKRIDFIITGLNEVQQEQVVIIELKQWSSAELTDKDALVKTRFQHGISETAHPSYQAWSYATLIKDYNQTVRDEQITLTPCAYLHNYPKDQIITNPRYEPYITEAPPFFQSDAGKLREFIKKYVKYGDSKDILYKIENGRLRPSKQLADNLVSMLKGNQEFIMLDDQKVVYETALSMIRKASADKKQVLIVKGGPGTGKSVVAINLLVETTRNRLVSRYVSKNAALSTTRQPTLSTCLSSTKPTASTKRADCFKIREKTRSAKLSGQPNVLFSLSMTIKGYTSRTSETLPILKKQHAPAMHP